MADRRYSKAQKAMLIDLHDWEVGQEKRPPVDRQEMQVTSLYHHYSKHRDFGDQRLTVKERQEAKKRARAGLRTLAERGDVEIGLGEHDSWTWKTTGEFLMTESWLLAKNGEVQMVSLTAQGRALAKKLTDEKAAAYDKRLAALSPEQRGEVERRRASLKLEKWQW